MHFCSDNQIEKELELLSECIEGNIIKLRNIDLGKLFLINGKSFRLFSKGRNVIYKIRGNSLWFLKIPVENQGSAISAEFRGFDAMRKLISDDYYNHPAAFKVDTDLGYLLYTAVPGEQLNKKLYGFCFLYKKFSSIEAKFFNFGNILAQMHKGGKSIEAPMITNSIYVSYQNNLSRINDTNPTINEIMKWVDENFPVDDGLTFIHGNCKLWNVIVDKHSVSLIDFETCGRGSLYNDLAKVCRDFFLFRSAVLFPWKRAYHALYAFLQGYNDLFPIDNELLHKYISLFVFNHYVQYYHIKNVRDSVGGIPISRSKYYDLMEKLLAGRYESVLPIKKL